MDLFFRDYFPQNRIFRRAAVPGCYSLALIVYFGWRFYRHNKFPLYGIFTCGEIISQRGAIKRTNTFSRPWEILELVQNRLTPLGNHIIMRYYLVNLK